jgi:hypothetical protein
LAVLLLRCILGLLLPEIILVLMLRALSANDLLFLSVFALILGVLHVFRIPAPRVDGAVDGN